MNSETTRTAAPVDAVVMRSSRVTVTLYCGDCHDLLPIEADAVVSDPPYGIGWRPRVNHTGDDHVWKDDTVFDPSLFLAFGRYHCFWGAQYFADKLPLRESWLCWVKRPLDNGDFSGDPRTYSTIELAWTDYARKPAFKSIVWDGGKRQGDRQNRTFCHPAQKPVELMTWCIGMLPDDCGVVLDPFMGSGTTGVACVREGRNFIGVEKDEKYFEIAVERIRRELAQERLF